MYKQDLYKIVEPVKLTTIKRLNKGKKWEYGYNKENDLVVLSKTGEIGEIIEMQGLVIALPKAPANIFKASSDLAKQKWGRFEPNEAFSKIKTRFDWDGYSKEFKELHYKYIDQEFQRRDNGFWFMNNGKPTYITGS